MVESEIARLEIQITQIQKDLKIEQQHQTTKSKQWSSVEQQQPPPPQTNNKSSPLPISKPSFDTKALHFISKAIKGDYALNHFRLLDHNAKHDHKDHPRDHNKETTTTPPLFDDQVKVHDQTKVVPKKSGLLVASSPLRDPRHPSPNV